MKLAVVSTKGGTGKTTTAVYLSAALAGRVLLVDADPQQSALSWSQQDELPFTVIAVARDLPRRVADLAQGYEHVIIDTPPGDLGIIRGALMAADTALVPASPTGLDVGRIRPTFELLAELEPVHQVDVGVLLTRVRARTVSARAAREILTGLGYPVLDTEIPMSEMIAGAFGSVPADLSRYADLVKELEL
jgi:chromosome partitioning protein